MYCTESTWSFKQSRRHQRRIPEHEKETLDRSGMKDGQIDDCEFHRQDSDSHPEQWR